MRKIFVTNYVDKEEIMQEKNRIAPEHSKGGNQINIMTFGCRLNTLESEVIRRRAGLSELQKFGCIFIFNTCAVTAEAERQIGQAVRKCRRENPDAIIIVTGCSANASAQKYSDMQEVDFVIGNKEKSLQGTYDSLVKILQDCDGENTEDARKNYRRVFVEDLKNSAINLSDDMDFAVGNFEGRTRAFIQIQQGCRNRCAFCIVPNLRGNSVSFSRDAIFSQVESVVKNGYKEIVLTGVDIASYGSKSLSANPLADLICDILHKFPDIKRVRLSSLDPACNYDDLIALAKIDKRLNRRLLDSVVDGINIWFNGLTAEEKIFGGRIEFREEENSEILIRGGKAKFHIYATPPSPAREIEFLLEYDAEYVASSLN